MKKKTKLTELQAKRVAILKDALQQIKAEAYNVRSGNGYVVSWELNEKVEALVKVCDIISDTGHKTQIQKFIGKLINKKNPCEVCARGAMLISSIRKFNHVSLGQLENNTLDNITIDRTDELFGEKNASLMEIYFEDGNYEFSEKYPYPTERLIAIFENAIENRGIFKP